MKRQANPAVVDRTRWTRDDPGAACPDDFLDHALARVGRLEAVLAAVGGVLHDVSNLLTVLSGNLYLMTETVRDHPSLFDESRGALTTSERASALIRELLSFARDQHNEDTVICPANKVAAIESLLRRAVSPSRQLVVSNDSDPWHVRASAVQLESAVTNLVLNAHEAMTVHGRIDVCIENVGVDLELSDAMALPPGDFVRVRVADDGPGIPADMLSRITQPLFSSKPPEHGNGMGLAMVQRFAVRAGGALRIESVEGEGTTVDLWLPRSHRDTADTAGMAMPLSTLPPGSETVLVATHDAEVRSTVERLLDALGYTVIVAGDRKQALEAARAQTDLSLVVCERSVEDIEADARWLATLRHVKPEIRQLAILDLGVDDKDAAPDADAYVYRPVAVAELASAARVAVEEPS